MQACIEGEYPHRARTVHAPRQVFEQLLQEIAAGGSAPRPQGLPHGRGNATPERGGGARAICSAVGHWVTRRTAGAVGHGHDHEGPLNAEAPKAAPRGRGPSGGLRQPPPKRGGPSSVYGAHTPLPPPLRPPCPDIASNGHGGRCTGPGWPPPSLPRLPTRRATHLAPPV